MACNLIYASILYRRTKRLNVFWLQELYHELHALDKFEQDYRRKLQEEDNSNASQRGNCACNLW